MIAGWRCAVCATTVDIAAVHPFPCPRATPADPYHVLHPLEVGRSPRRWTDPNPFVAFGPRLAWWAFARTHGMTEAACVALTRDARRRVHGHAVRALAAGVQRDRRERVGQGRDRQRRRQPQGPSPRHDPAPPRGGRVARARRPRSRRPLAIASCGNAAIAAATLAQRAEWPLDVFVPTWAGAGGARAAGVAGGAIHPCPRRSDDPPGDPAVLRFREAVAAGAVPFSVQGPENAPVPRRRPHDRVGDGRRRVALDRVVVQVGGGAFATCTGWGLGPDVRLDAVQSAGLRAVGPGARRGRVGRPDGPAPLGRA